ncbi:MAG: SAM-dependent DNA methyltransferase [Actinobacteria bacterium]|nr:SAM-dependent DNA methyltransferase [Actinomycetota bacterium]
MAIESASVPVAGPPSEHGEVFTRRWVVELILDLVGYTPDRDLVATRAIEPACGSGAFIVPMLERLAESARLHGRDLSDASGSIGAVDLIPRNVELSRAAVRRALGLIEVPAAQATELAGAWIRQGDFLLEPPVDRSADFVVGNPPYVRLEAVARERSDAYRLACKTMGGRADVYIGFYEHGLRALRDDAMLGFICADRWMRNAYGARLRAMVSEEWAVDTIISMTGVDAFEDEVDAYPAITILRRGEQNQGPLAVEATSRFDSTSASEVVELTAGSKTDHVHRPGYRGARLAAWFSGPEGWPHGSPDRLAAIADLEARYPPLEDVNTGTKVGIGVATGADRVFITEDTSVVEEERLLPMALPRDIASGTVRWSGKYLVNPWDADGLVNLDDWPRLSNYLSGHRELLAKRHTAKNGRWHKTIDRVIEGLADREKLYLPDFKETIFPVLDEGRTYPHHNLYWVTSASWDLRVLGGLLLSDVAGLFIEAYSVRMRGGYLRFQAQYLRRIRVPKASSIEGGTAAALAHAFERRDRQEATRLALPLYGLDGLPA